MCARPVRRVRLAMAMAMAPSASRAPAMPMAIVVQAMPGSAGACSEVSGLGLASSPCAGRVGYSRAVRSPARLWRDPAPLASVQRRLCLSCAAAVAGGASAGACGGGRRGERSGGQCDGGDAGDDALERHGRAPWVWWTVPMSATATIGRCGCRSPAVRQHRVCCERARGRQAAGATVAAVGPYRARPGARPRCRLGYALRSARFTSVRRGSNVEWQ